MRSNRRSNFDAFMGSNKGLAASLAGCAAVGAASGAGIGFLFTPLLGPFGVVIGAVAGAVLTPSAFAVGLGIAWCWDRCCCSLSPKRLRQIKIKEKYLGDPDVSSMRPVPGYTSCKENREKSTFSDEASKFRRKSRDSGEAYRELVEYKIREARMLQFEIEKDEPTASSGKNASSEKNPFSF